MILWKMINYFQTDQVPTLIYLIQSLQICIRFLTSSVDRCDMSLIVSTCIKHNLLKGAHIMCGGKDVCLHEDGVSHWRAFKWYSGLFQPSDNGL